MPTQATEIQKSVPPARSLQGLVMVSGSSAIARTPHRAGVRPQGLGMVPNRRQDANITEKRPEGIRTNIALSSTQHPIGKRMVPGFATTNQSSPQNDPVGHTGRARVAGSADSLGQKAATSTVERRKGVARVSGSSNVNGHSDAAQTPPRGEGKVIVRNSQRITDPNPPTPRSTNSWKTQLAQHQEHRGLITVEQQRKLAPGRSNMFTLPNKQRPGRGE